MKNQRKVMLKLCQQNNKRKFEAKQQIVDGN